MFVYVRMAIIKAIIPIMTKKYGKNNDIFIAMKAEACDDKTDVIVFFYKTKYKVIETQPTNSKYEKIKTCVDFSCSLIKYQ